MRSARAFSVPLVAVLVFAAAAAFYASFSDYGFHREDEGSLLLQFWRWSSGETPYRDFHVGYTPGVYIVHKTLMQWFGPGLLPGRHLLALVHSLSAALLFALAVRLTGSWKWALLAPVLFVGSIPVYAGDFAAFNIPYPAWYNLALFALGAALMLRLAERPSRAALLAGGVLAGLAFTFKPNVGLFQLAAVALVTLRAVGRPRSRGEQGLWWAWWLAILGGLLFVFSSAQSATELVSFLAPAMVAALAVARDAHRTPSRDRSPRLLACALLVAAGFLAVCVPWLAWSWSILGPEWFARRALFFGAGFEAVYYLGVPSRSLGLLAVLAGAAAWMLPGALRRRGVPTWPFPVAAAAIVALAFGVLAATRPMPEGLYAAVMSLVEPRLFSLATVIQWGMLLVWLARTNPDDRQSRQRAVLTICGVLLYLQIFPRTDLMHWVAAAPLLFPLLAWLLQALASRWADGAGRAARLGVCASLALPVVAIAGLRIGHFLDARWDFQGGWPVRTPETTLRIAHAPVSINVGAADVYRDLEATVGFITGHTAPSDPVFTFPILDYVSYFSLRSPGNRHGYYFPGWPGHETEAEVLAFLHRRPPRLAVTIHEHRLYFANAATYYFLFDEFFSSRYRRVARRGPYAILAEGASELPVDSDAAAEPAEPQAIANALGAERMRELDEALASTDPLSRLQAVRRMAEWKIVGEFDPLRRALGDPDARVRTAAVQAIPRTTSPAMRAALLERVLEGELTTGDSVLAIRAAGVSCDDSCVPMLVPLLDRRESQVANAARVVLAGLPTSSWQSAFWWTGEPETEPFPEPVRSRLSNAIRDREADPLLRSVAFAYADRLGLDRCPEVLRSHAVLTPDQVGPEFTVCLALHHLSRASCPGPWLEGALRWLPLDPTLTPRTILREARRRPDEADAALAEAVRTATGADKALALWICGASGGPACLEAARSTLAASPHEADRVAAAWAWSQLAQDDVAVAELRARVAADASPQVRETAVYGLDIRGE